MPIARFRTDDGRVARFNVPDGTTPEQAQAMFNQWAAAQPPAPKDVGENPRTAAMLRGLTMGASDYVGAAGQAAGDALANILSGKAPGIGQSYEDARRRQVSEREAFAEQSPVQNLGAELIGGLAMPLPASRATGLRGRVLESAKIGAGTGAISGALNAYGGPSDKGEGALKGATIGGTLGAALPVVGRAIGAVASPFVKRFSDPTDVAAGRLGELIGKTERTPDELAAAARKLGPAGRLLDADPLLTAEAERIVASAGKPSAEITKSLNERALGRGQRLAATVNRGLKPDEYLEAEEKILTRMATQAKPFYDKAYQEGRVIVDDTIDKILETDAGQGALSKAVQMMKNEMLPLGPTDATGKMRGLSLQTLDYVKRSLDDSIGAAVRAGEKNQSRVLQGLKSKLVERLDDIAPSYKQAREIYGGDAEVLQALEAGKNVLREEADTLARDVGKMSFAEKDAFRTGAARSIMNAIKASPDKGDATRRVTGNQLLRERLRPMFDTAREYREFISAFGREKSMLGAEQQILGNSRTAFRESLKTDAKDTTISDVAASARQGAIPFLGSVYSHARDWASGISPDVNAQMARMLLSSDPTAVRSAVTAAGFAPEVARAVALRLAEMGNRAASLGGNLAGSYLAPRPDDIGILGPVGRNANPPVGILGR